jgi:BASS family bile acid:Na+ symporter
MNATELIGLAIKASMFLIVFALGLRATVEQMTFLFRNPGLLSKAILSMNVVMLAIAIALALWIDPPPAVKIAMIALALSPVPPILPGKQLKSGGSADYTIGLLVDVAIVAIVLVPLAIELLGRGFGITMHVPAAKVATIVFVSIVIPLALGVLVRRFAPAFAERIAHPVSLLAMIVLVVAVVPVLVVATPQLKPLIGNGVLICLVAFSVIGLAVGHFFGGPDPDNRTVLALATGARHPAIPLAIAGINFPDEKAVMVVVLYHLIIATIVAVPYVKWRTREHATGIRRNAT